MGWTAYPGARTPSPLLLEAFGQLVPDGSVTGEEDLYSVFRSRAELMGWSGTGAAVRPSLWGMNDAELTTEGDTSRIGWVQVGLEAGVEVALALPPFIQCFHDALRRFGTVELSALQLTAHHLERGAGSCAGDLVSGLNWFRAHSSAGTEARIVIEPGGTSLATGFSAELIARLQHLNTGPFTFGTAEPEQAIPVTLPEWSANAIAWALALVIDQLRTSQPDMRDITIRLTRGPQQPVRRDKG